MDSQSSIRCFITPNHDCSYLADKKACNLVIDPQLPLSDVLLGNLLNSGFRRSGEHIYRPKCQSCQECRSLRVTVRRFKPNRSQRRNLKLNADLDHFDMGNGFKQEHFELYCRYLESRHQGSEMSEPSPDEYLNFLTAKNISTHFHEFRRDGRLLAVAVTDHTPFGLSAVYTFFEPEFAALGLGIYAVLYQIKLAEQLGLPWVFLGYWVKACKKMNYKTNFRPYELYINEEWRQFEE